MSTANCGCQNSPCGCADLNTVEAPRQSRCDRYVPGSKNVWVERGDSPNDVTAPGVCMLDSMTDEQIIYCLERDEQARADLLVVTTDEHLLDMARNIPRLPVHEENDRDQAQLNTPHNPGSIPFYAVFRGQPPFNQ